MVSSGEGEGKGNGKGEKMWVRRGMIEDEKGRTIEGLTKKRRIIKEKKVITTIITKKHNFGRQ